MRLRKFMVYYLLNKFQALTVPLMQRKGYNSNLLGFPTVVIVKRVIYEGCDETNMFHFEFE